MASLSGVNISQDFPGGTDGSNSHTHSNYSIVVIKDVDWLFDREKPNEVQKITVLPVLAIIFFVVCLMLKCYKWYKESVQMKTRGDYEFGNESEVNYGIITAGDKEFCHVEIRSDTTSVYDTVNSFRLLGNGHAVGGSNNYHDTVTSYKSLLLQRLDGTHYDSVKSYKAFLKQVTQHTDLAVDVKLLENYPPRSKSVEHCVLEEESSGISEAVKPLAISVGKSNMDCNKKKTRHRRASGDVLGAMRKRSASNPTYHSSRTGAASLPSISQTISSDSSNEDDAFISLASDRRKLWEVRKKMARSCSGGRLAKGSPSQDLLAMPQNMTRRRHYSADSCRRPRKPLGSHRAELKDLRESISETDPKVEDSYHLRKKEDSSSENADSGPTSCNSSISSDAIASESEEDDTQLVTQVSVTSDDHTVSCDAVSDSCGELTSSAERIACPVNGDFVNGLSNKHCITNNIKDVFDQPADSTTLSAGSHQNIYTSTIQNVTDSSIDSPIFTNAETIINCDDGGNYSTSSVYAAKSIMPTNTQHLLSSSSHPLDKADCMPNRESPSSLCTSSSDVFEQTRHMSKYLDNSNPRRVKRFHVTFVSSDVSSPNSE